MPCKLFFASASSSVSNNRQVVATFNANSSLMFCCSGVCDTLYSCNLIFSCDQIMLAFSGVIQSLLICILSLFAIHLAFFCSGFANLCTFVSFLHFSLFYYWHSL